MKEHKYRAWDKHNKKMIYGPMAICSGDGGWVLFTADCEGVDCSKAIHPIQQYEIMQFTGRLDKNRREVYERDIIWQGVYNIDTGQKNAYVVDFQEYRYVLVPLYLWTAPEYCGGGYEAMTYSYPDRYEVIGSVYENQELMPQEQV